jgi:ABC-type Fe3+/spermidine/putrescine transport system ATPase subunit
LKLREAMQFELRELQRQLAITTVYVTHDQSEAMYLSDRIAVLNNGRIEQVGTGREIYERPATRFVAEFVGQINIWPADPVGQEEGFVVMRAGGETMRAMRPARAPAGRGCLAVRPHNIAIANGTAPPGDDNRLEGRIVSQVFNGNLVHVKVETAVKLIHVEARPSVEMLPEGSRVTLHWKPSDTLVLEE